MCIDCVRQQRIASLAAAMSIYVYKTHAHSQIHIPLSLSIKFPKSKCTPNLQKVTGCQVHHSSHSSSLSVFDPKPNMHMQRLGQRLWQNDCWPEGKTHYWVNTILVTASCPQVCFTNRPPYSNSWVFLLLTHQHKAPVLFWQAFSKTHKSKFPFMNHKHTHIHAAMLLHIYYVAVRGAELCLEAASRLWSLWPFGLARHTPMQNRTVKLPLPSATFRSDCSREAIFCVISVSLAKTGLLRTEPCAGACMEPLT